MDGLEAFELDPTPEVTARYLGDAPSALYLVRPDQVIAARWVTADEATIKGMARDIWEGQA